MTSGAATTPRDEDNAGIEDNARIEDSGGSRAYPPSKVTVHRIEVPTLTMLRAVGVGVGAWASLWVLNKTDELLQLLLVAVFFTIVLNPAVEWLRHRGLRRGVAVGIVTLLFLLALIALIFMFVRPLATQAGQFSDSLPKLVEDAQQGRGRVGDLVQRMHLDSWLHENLPTLRQRANGFLQPSKVFGSAVSAIGSVISTLIAVITVVVLTVLMLLQGYPIANAALKVLPTQRQERMRRIGHDATRAITGYVNGNLLISVIAGTTSWICMMALDVPYAGVLALWVAFADLIPLIGATIGAAFAIFVAFLYSTPAGVIALIFFIVYQQLENHILQPAIMSRTVALSPLTVLVAVLFGVTLFGMLGALMAIPLAAVVKVVGRDVLKTKGLIVEHPGPPVSVSDA